MTDLGEVWLADLNEERRRAVMILSNRRFNQLSGRALVAPDVADPGRTDTPGTTPQFPWRIEFEGHVFAVDHLGSLPTARLLERLGHAPSAAFHAATSALKLVT